MKATPPAGYLPGFLTSALLILLVFFASPAYAQEATNDLVVKKDGTILEVNIVESKPDEILYRKKGDPEGPIYAILKSDLLSVRYKNGEEVKFTVTVDHFYDSKVTQPAPSGPLNEYRYEAEPPKNEFQTKILALPSERLEPNYQLFKAGAKKGKALGIAGIAVQVGVSLLGTIILAANTETNHGITYYTNEAAARTGALMMIGGTIAGTIMIPTGFVRAAKNNNKAKYIRNEMRRRGVQPTQLR